MTDKKRRPAKSASKKKARKKVTTAPVPLKKKNEAQPVVIMSASAVPEILTDGRKKTGKRIIEFFTAQIRNPNTRSSYTRAVSRFCEWCAAQGVTLNRLSPPLAAAYVEALLQDLSAPTVKQHLAAMRMLCDWLVTGGCLEFNPFSSVRGPKHSTKRGKTPVLYENEARELLDSIDTSHVVGLRDKAIISTMIFSFARVSAVVGMKVKDFQVNGRRSSIALHEKGGKWARVPCHHQLAETLDAYLKEAGTGDDRDGMMFRSSRGRSRTLTKNGMARQDVLAMIKRRCQTAGLSEDICNHSFRATGITAYLGNGGELETAAAIAGHSSTRTTQLYNRNEERITQAELERIQI